VDLRGDLIDRGTGSGGPAGQPTVARCSTSQAASSQASISEVEAEADPTRLVSLPKGLDAHVVTTGTSPNTDMIALWPNSGSSRQKRGGERGHGANRSPPRD
jgi:hypothetical protein